jgi:hypothetical protein
LSGAGAQVQSLVIMDELDCRMRRTAARLASLARRAIGSAPAEPVASAPLLEGLACLARHVPELAGPGDELAEAVAAVEPRPGTGAPTPAVLSALVERASAGDASALERAAAWAKVLSASGGSRTPEGALALARFATASGESFSLPEGLEEPADRPPEGRQEGAAAVRFARCLVAAGDERSREVSERALGVRPGPAGGVGGAGADETRGGTEPSLTADRLALSSELWDSEGHVRHLDAIERAVLNRALFAQTDDGAGVVGRTHGGACGAAEDDLATPALARSLALAADRVLFADAGGALVSGLPSNASAVVTVGGTSRLRCIVSTQLPLRGWSSWTFEPINASGGGAAPSSSTQRPGRRQRQVVRRAGEEEHTSGSGPAEFSLRVRVPKWAVGGKAGPSVKIDGKRAGAKKTGGFLVFDLPADRPSRVEVILDIAPGLIERRSAVSWASEVALVYGTLILTAGSRLNPGEDLTAPLRIVSERDDLELAGDIRRRFPLVAARAVGGGGREGCVLFSPLADVGGLAAGTGGSHPVTCDGFRTWHRRGR